MCGENYSGGVFCVRIFMAVFNTLTCVAGIMFIFIGNWLYRQSDPRSDDEIITDIISSGKIPTNGEYKVFSVLLMSLGCWVAVVSAFGCFGACLKSRCLLMTYLIFVAIILKLQLLVAIFAIVYRQPLGISMREELFETMQRYRPNTPSANAWDAIHYNFECCGLDSYTDWFGVDAWPGKQQVPDSCCLDSPFGNQTGCGMTLDPSLWRKKGCLAQIHLWMLEKLHVLATVIIVFVFLQLYGIFASSLLFYHSRGPKSRRMYK